MKLRNTERKTRRKKQKRDERDTSASSRDLNLNPRHWDVGAKYGTYSSFSSSYPQHDPVFKWLWRALLSEGVICITTEATATTKQLHKSKEAQLESLKSHQFAFLLSWLYVNSIALRIRRFVSCWIDPGPAPFVENILVMFHNNFFRGGKEKICVACCYYIAVFPDEKGQLDLTSWNVFLGFCFAGAKKRNNILYQVLFCFLGV